MNHENTWLQRNWRSSSYMGGSVFLAVHANFSLIIGEVETTKSDRLLAELNPDRWHCSIQASFGEVLLHHMVESVQQLISAYYKTIILSRKFLMDGSQLQSEEREGIKVWVAYTLTDLFTPVINKGQRGKPSWITFQLSPSSADIPGLYLENKYWML